MKLPLRSATAGVDYLHNLSFLNYTHKLSFCLLRGVHAFQRLERE